MTFTMSNWLFWKFSSPWLEIDCHGHSNVMHKDLEIMLKIKSLQGVKHIRRCSNTRSKSSVRARNLAITGLCWASPALQRTESSHISLNFQYSTAKPAMRNAFPELRRRCGSFLTVSRKRDWEVPIITENQNCGVDSWSCNRQQEARSHRCHHQHQRLVLCQRRIQRLPRTLHTALRHITHEFRLILSRELESGFRNGRTCDHTRNFNTDWKRKLQLRISFISPLQIDPLHVTFEQNTMF